MKQLKNRYNDVSSLKRFVLGIDRSKMKLFDLDDSAQAELVNTDLKVDDSPTFDKGKFGSGMKAEKRDKSGFDDFQF